MWHFLCRHWLPTYFLSFLHLMIIFVSWILTLCFLICPYYMYPWMKLAEIQHGTEFLSRTTLLHLLCSIIRYMFESIFNYRIFCLFILVFTKYFHGSSTSTESILRSRAMMISGRLLSRENIYTFIDESSKTSSVSGVTKFFFFWRNCSFASITRVPTFLDMWRGME